MHYQTSLASCKVLISLKPNNVYHIFLFYLCCILEYIGVLRKWFLERTVLLLTDFFMHKSLFSSDFTFLENEAFESVVTSFKSALLSSPLLSFIQKRSPAIFWMRTPLCPCFARRIANKVCQLSLIFLGMITTKNLIAFDNFLSKQAGAVCCQLTDNNGLYLRFIGTLNRHRRSVHPHQEDHDHYHHLDHDLNRHRRSVLICLCFNNSLIVINFI